MSPIARTTAALPVLYKMRVALSGVPSPAWVTAFHLATQATPGQEATTSVVGDEIIFACVPEHVGAIDAHIDHWIAVANGKPDVPASPEMIPHGPAAPHEFSAQEQRLISAAVRRDEDLKTE